MNRKTMTTIPALATASVLMMSLPAVSARAEEIYLHKGVRIMAMVESISADGEMKLRLANGKMHTESLREVVTITFRGREPRTILAGTQEFHLINGDRLRGQIVGLDGDTLVITNSAAGKMQLPMETVHGFLTMPLAGKAGRRALELVTGDDEEPTGKMDQILDRRAAGYLGVIEAISSKELLLDHERIRKSVPLNILYLSGVRLAKHTRNPRPKLPQSPFVKIHTRDMSAVDGLAESVRDGKWSVRPLWRPGKVLSFTVEEITKVEVLNGQAIYLSQLQPSKVQEKTLLAPRQRYKMNRNCRGNAISVAGNIYAWGIGVHAESSLTFDVGGIWSMFEAALGIDDHAGKNGSVIFTLLGDGKQIYRSKEIRSGAESATLVSVPIKGVNSLTLRVEATEDLDLGDAANWAAARLVR